MGRLTPVAVAHTGNNAFDPNKQVQVCDVRVEAGALWARLKGIKQDLRMQRPEAAGNNDWIVIGDIPGSEFSILVWTQRLFAFHGQRREPKDAFYVNAARTKPYLYSAALKDVRRLLSKVVGDDDSKDVRLARRPCVPLLERSDHRRGQANHGLAPLVTEALVAPVRRAAPATRSGRPPAARHFLPLPSVAAPSPSPFPPSALLAATTEAPQAPRG